MNPPTRRQEGEGHSDCDIVNEDCEGGVLEMAIRGLDTVHREGEGGGLSSHPSFLWPEAELLRGHNIQYRVVANRLELFLLSIGIIHRFYCYYF